MDRTAACADPEVVVEPFAKQVTSSKQVSCSPRIVVSSIPRKTATPRSVAMNQFYCLGLKRREC